MTSLRYSLRSLSRAPWFTAAAVLTFAVGIGLNVAVFSIVDRVLFRPLPYGHVDRLVLLRSCGRTGACAGGFPSVIAYEGQRRLKTIEALAVAGFPASRRLSDAADQAPLRLSGVSANLLQVIGVQPVLGRDFLASDLAEKRRVALLGYHTWRARFHGSTDVVGATLGTGRYALTIIGILPRDFIPPTWTAVDPTWEGITLEIDPRGWAYIDSTAGMVAVPVARLASNASLSSAQAEVDALVAALSPQLRDDEDRIPRIRVDPIQSSLFSRFSDNAWLIVAAATILLLLACSNLATLLLARGRSREHATAVQAAIGASVRRLLLMSLAESLMICFAGTVVAIATISVASQAVLAILPPLFARYAAGVFDTRVLVMALIVAVSGSVLAGIAQAVRATRIDVLTLLQRSATPTRAARLRGGRGLLALEAAFGVALVLSAIVVVRSFTTLAGQDLGFRSDGLFTVSWRAANPAVSTSSREARLVAYQQVLETLGRIPGIETAAGADSPVASGYAPMRPLTKDDSIAGARFQVTADYFATIGTRFLAGRAFTPLEVASRAPVAILSHSALRTFFPADTALQVVGRPLVVDGEAPRTIVGVVPDLKSRHIELTDAQLFLPLGAEPSNYLAAIVRISGEHPPSLGEVQQRLSATLGYRVIPDVRNVAQGIDGGLAEPRFRAVLLVVLAGAALLLAAVGLFAVSTFEAAARRREIGIRLTLGARPGQLQRMILLEASKPVLVGVSSGMLAAYWGEQHLRTFMYGMRPHEPATYVAVVALLLGTAVVAAWLPARRAARLDPAEVLRAE